MLLLNTNKNHLEIWSKIIKTVTKPSYRLIFKHFQDLIKIRKKSEKNSYKFR